MKKNEKAGNNRTAIWILLIGVPFIIAIVYFKMQSDEAMMDGQTDKESKTTCEIAVPDTTVAADAMPVIKDTVVVYNTVEYDTRSAMEAGDEDGYWDGWYDAAETGETHRFDDQSNFKQESERKAYAKSYREGYEKGFRESKSQRDKATS